jgi:hypothetical protein
MNVRSLSALALAALLVPAAAQAAPAPSGSRSQALEIGGFIGYEDDDFEGLALRLDGEMPFGAVAPNVDLSFVGSIGYSRLSLDAGRGIDVDANILKIIPAARFTFELNPEFSLFADGGLGLYYASAEADQGPFGFGGTVDDDDSEFSLMMRIGGGAWYRVSETTRIGLAIEFDPYFGDFDQTTFIIQGGAMFRL